MGGDEKRMFPASRNGTATWTRPVLHASRRRRKATKQGTEHEEGNKTAMNKGGCTSNGLQLLSCVALAGRLGRDELNTRVF